MYFQSLEARRWPLRSRRRRRPIGSCAIRPCDGSSRTVRTERDAKDPIADMVIDVAELTLNGSIDPRVFTLDDKQVYKVWDSDARAFTRYEEVPFG